MQPPGHLNKVCLAPARWGWARPYAGLPERFEKPACQRRGWTPAFSLPTSARLRPSKRLRNQGSCCRPRRQRGSMRLRRAASRANRCPALSDTGSSGGCRSASPHTLDPRPDRASCGGRARLCSLGRTFGFANSHSRPWRGHRLFAWRALVRTAAEHRRRCRPEPRSSLHGKREFAPVGVTKPHPSYVLTWTRALGDASFEIIVSNPPYIGSSEIAGLEAEVQAFDPRLALDGGEDGLEAFRTILAEAFRVLGAKGLLIFETGDRQAQIVREMMVNSARGACCLEARVLVDLNGIERAVAGRRQSVDCETKIQKKDWKSGSFGIGSW